MRRHFPLAIMLWQLTLMPAVVDAQSHVGGSGPDEFQENQAPVPPPPPTLPILPPLPRAYSDTAVEVEGTVVAITHTDRDMGPDPRDLGHGVTSGERRVERTFDLRVRIERTVKARNPAVARPPSGNFVVIHGTKLFGRWPWGGVYRIDQLVEGTKARFYLERRDNGAWFIWEPDGLVLLDGS